MGDKIFIADKQTLDSVNTKSQNILTNTENIINSFNKIGNENDSGASENSGTVMGKLNKLITSSSQNNSNDFTKGILIDNNKCEIQMEKNLSQTILSLNNFSGIIDFYSSSDAFFILNIIIDGNISSIPLNIFDNKYIEIIKNIKFKNSFKINITPTVTDSSYYIYYFKYFCRKI